MFKFGIYLNYIIFIKFKKFKSVELKFKWKKMIMNKIS